MGKSVTVAGIVGFGSLIASAGAPAVIEGLPNWVNIALFAVGAILIAGAFIAHLIANNDGDGGKAQTSHGNGSPNIGTVSGDANIGPTIIGFSAVNSSHTTMSGTRFQFGEFHDHGRPSNRRAPPAVVAAFAGLYGNNIFVQVRQISQTAEAGDFTGQIIDVLRSGGINAVNAGVFMGYTRFDGVEVSGDPSPETKAILEKLIKIFQMSQLTVALANPVPSETPFIRIDIGDNR